MVLTMWGEYGIINAVKNNNAGIAQSVEQLIRNQQVVSSSLISSSKSTRNRRFSGAFRSKMFLFSAPHFLCLTHNALITNQFFEIEIV